MNLVDHKTQTVERGPVGSAGSLGCGGGTGTGTPVPCGESWALSCLRGLFIGITCWLGGDTAQAVGPERCLKLSHTKE